MRERGVRLRARGARGPGMGLVVTLKRGVRVEE